MIMPKTRMRRCIGTLVLVCLLHCGGIMTSSHPCATAWQAIKALEFRDWYGLPMECTYGDLESEFKRFRDEYGQGGLGRKHVITRYRIHLAEGYAHHLKEYFRQEHIALIQIEYPALPYAAADLLQRLGPPEFELDYHREVMPVPKGAWVYPARGLTLFLDAGRSAIMGIGLFHPCHLAEYLDDIHPDTRMSELPLRAFEQ